MLVQTAPAAVLSPEPTPQPVAQPPGDPRKHSGAVAVMEVTAPSTHHLVDILHRFRDGSPLGAMVEDAADFLPQLSTALPRGLHVRITPPASAAPHFEAKPKKADRFPGYIHCARLFRVKCQAFGFQPAFDLRADLRALSRGTEHDKVVGIAHHAMTLLVTSIDLMIQGIEVDIRQ